MRNPQAHPVSDLLNAFLEALPRDAFSRKRKDVVWTPELTALALLIMVLEHNGKGYDSLLSTLRCRRGDLLRVNSCASAFCRARKKLTSEILQPAWEAFRRAFIDHFASLQPVVHGRQLVAIDGVWINTRRSRRLFAATRRRRPGRPRKDPKGQPQILLVVLVDVLTRTPIAWEEVTPGTGERAAAMRLLGHLTPCMVLLADRGFPSRSLLDHLMAAKIPFIVRMATGTTAMREVTTFIGGRRNDRRVDFALGRGRHAATARLRLIRIRPRYAGRNASDPWILLTSLPGCKRWNREVIAALYHERWGIETFFRELKGLLNADHFHAYDLDGVRAEITMLMLGSSLMAAGEMVALQDQYGRMPKWDDQQQRRANRSTLATIVPIMITSDPRTVDVQELLGRELGVAARSAKRRRPGRSYPRICKSFVGKWKNGFKRLAA